MKLFLSALAAFTATSVVEGCTNILVTPEASTSNEAMIAYNADSASLYGSLYHYPRTGGGSRDLYDWDSGAFLGSIPEAEKTHNVVGNCNEVGLCIGETTFGGLEELCETFPGSKVDYGSLIWVTLQRASNAREAIKVMDNLMQTYGYASEGESFSITDSREVWINEVIGKGTYEKGSVWVAKKIPAGYVSSHANQARITTFEWDDESKAMYAHDVMSFAQKIGLIKEGNGVEKEAFSFSDTYDPVTFEGARFCEGRVWSFFSSVMGEEFEKEYVDYASGFNLTNRMPLWVKPAEKISLSDVFSHMRNHFEGSELAFDGDVGAGGFGAPYRWRPLTWEYGDDTYVNERAIGTQQTGWNFVASVRPSMPTPMQAVIWFGADDSATTVRVPFYASATELPLSFVGKGPQDGVVPPMMTFDLNSAFYVTNLVSNWAYSRWSDIYPVVLEKIVEYEASFISQLHEVDQKVLGLINNGQQEEALNLMNAFAQKLGNGFTQQWFGFFGELFVRFRDGYDITPNSEDPECGCTVGGVGYNDATYGRIAEETGDQYKEPSGDDSLKERQFNPKNKLKVRGV